MRDEIDRWNRGLPFYPTTSRPSRRGSCSQLPHSGAVVVEARSRRGLVELANPRLITVTLLRVARTSWFVDFHPACESWANDLDQSDAEALLAAIRVLREQGPNLGRPLVDTIKGSRHTNMKELRPGSTGRSEIRLLFAFDKERKAILLVGGDKSDDWKGWYDRNIPIADARFDEHQGQIDERRGTKKAAKQAKGLSPKGRGRQ